MILRALQTAYAASLRIPAGRLSAALANPAAAQERRLARFLREGAGTVYGRAHGYEQISSFRRFQDRVPIATYETLASHVERIARGERDVLTRQPVRMLERTSGSSARRKLVPYTDGLLADFSAATGPWLADLYRRFPGLASTRQYWSISPVSAARERSPGGVPIGFEDDAEYFGPLARWALGRIRAVPGRVARLPIDDWRRTTARHLLEAGDLGLISVWSPSFLLLLLEHIEREAESLLPALPPRRRQEVRSALARDGRAGEALWPRLQVVSLWADGAAADLVPRVRERFPTTALQPKGLLATEGVVTLPLWGLAGGAVPALTSHVIELCDLNEPARRPIPVHEARPGASYSPLLSTGNGFARYRLEDALTCTARAGQVPLFRFDGRLDGGSDLRGEKLSPRLVEAALRDAGAAARVDWEFALLAPVLDEPPRYQLYLESGAGDAELRRLSEGVERKLLDIFHYRYCRELGQLGPVRAVRVSGGRRAYEATLVARGMKAGDIKPAALDARPIWSAAFGLAHERP